MGILRSDRVSGLGGANAINGSVKFSYDQDALIVPPSSDFNLGTADYTIEAWVYPEQEGASLMIYAVGDSDSTAKMGKFYYRSTKKFTYWCQSSVQITSSGTFNMGSWYHVALVNSSGTQTLYVNGVSQGTSTYSGFGGDAFLVEVGKNPSNTGQSMNGYISNLRVQKGKAEYTAAFTPPTTRLEKTPETVLLCCQSPGDVTQEATGKSLVIGKASGDDSGPVAARFVPDKGEDYGTTFEDNTKFDTLSYMVPPGGTTTQRGRGRAVMGGFYKGPNTYYSNIEYLNIQSLGNSIKFGDLTLARTEIAACSSSTRALFAGGTVPGGGTGGTKQNIIDYVTIATTANAINFGDLTDTIRTLGGCSNETRGIFAGGIDDPARLATIDYVTIASAGDGADFGDLTEARRNVSAHSSTTRGIFAGGLNPGPAYVNTIDYITIATTGDATNFGDLTALVYATTSCSNSTRGVIMGGTNPSGATNVIDYVTIASTGDAVDFGDITVARADGAGVASPTRGLMVGGETPSNDYNTIDYVTIASTGNAKDFGDASVGESRGQAGSSDCHGGIS